MIASTPSARAASLLLTAPAVFLAARWVGASPRELPRVAVKDLGMRLGGGGGGGEGGGGGWVHIRSRDGDRKISFSSGMHMI